MLLKIKFWFVKCSFIFKHYFLTHKSHSMDNYKSLLKGLISAIILLGVIYISYETCINRKMMADLANTDKVIMQKVDQTVTILSVDSTHGSTTTTVLVTDMANGGLGVPAPGMTVVVYKPGTAGLMMECERGVTNSEGWCQLSERNTICCDVRTTINVMKATSVIGTGNFRSIDPLSQAKVYINQPPVTR